MNKKVILTEQQHTLIINQILKETVDKLDEMEANGSLDEGFWDTIKYGLSKLGRYKAGGKIFGKGKVDTQYAQKIKDIIGKQNNQMIKKLDDLIKETNPQFPNNEDPQLFLQTIMEIAAVYDSIIAATKLPENTKGSMNVTIANEVIEDLRQYVNKYLDVDLKSIYSVTNEEDVFEEDILNEEQLKQIDEYFGLDEAVPARRNSGQMGAANQGPQVSGQASAGNYRKKQDIEDIGYEEIPNNPTQSNNTTQPNSPNQSNPLNAKDVRAGMSAKRGDGEDFASTRMDTLKSNKLPMTLAGIGASLGAFSWLVNTEWFKSLFDVVTKNPSIEYIKQAVQEKTDVFASIKPGEGMTQIMNRLNGMNLNPNSSPQEFVNGVKALGGGNVNAGIDALTQQGGIFTDPEAAKKALTEIVNNPNGHGSNLGQLFQGKLAGTGESFGDSLVTQTGGSLKGMIVNTIIKAVPKLVLKTSIKTGAGYALAKGFGAVLGPIGIGLVTAGALVKLMRMKGQKSSRAATLNALYQSLRDLKGVDLLPDKETGTQDGGNTGGGRQGGVSPEAKTNLYNNLKSLFQFIVNNKNTMGSEIRSGAGTGGAKAASQSQDFTKVSWITKNGTKTGKILGVGKTSDTSKVKSDETGKILNIKTKNLKKLSPNQLTEGRYIKDKYLIQTLSKSLPFDKLKNFEELLTRVELIRNSLKKMGATTGDKNLDNFLKQLDYNPIMVTNFAELMNVDPNNQQEVRQLLAFIKETLLAVYSGDYKTDKNAMIGKMSGLGGGNINKVSEEEIDEAAGYSATQPNKSFTKDASSKTTFKNNLVKFLRVAMNMFQYLHKSQGGNIARKDTTNKYTAVDRQELSNKLGKRGLGLPTTNAQKAKTQQNNTQATAASPRPSASQSSPTGQNVVPENLDPKLMEELKRIKKIMLS